MKTLLLCLMLLPGLCFAANDHAIVPGVRIGEVHLGFSKEQVRSALGEPTSSTHGSEGYENLSVKYDRHGKVSEIATSKSMFATSSGISTESKSLEFATNYFVRFKLCTEEGGDSAGTATEILDAIDTGIAFVSSLSPGSTPAERNTITVHRAGIALSTQARLRVCR